MDYTEGLSEKTTCQQRSIQARVTIALKLLASLSIRAQSLRFSFNQLNKRSIVLRWRYVG